MSCADSGNFLCKKFHKNSHTLHSLITCKLNLKQSNSLYSCIIDYEIVILSDSVPQGHPTSYGSSLVYDVSKESSLSYNFTAQTMTVSVICFANKLLLIPLSWQFDSVICCFYLLTTDYGGWAYLLNIVDKIFKFFKI